MSTPEEQLEMIREALKKPHEDKPVENTGAVSGDYGYELAPATTDTITLSSLGNYSNTVIGGGYTVGTGLGINYPNTASNTASIYTVGAGTGINWNSASGSWGPTNVSAKINLNGDDADILVNGVSLMDLLRDRLNIMIPNPELEKEWNELKELGDKYRELEKKLKEQGEMWAKLKQMPPPDPLY